MGVAQAALRGRTGKALAARLSSGHVVMLLAGALGVLLTLSVLRSADDTRSVLVAAKDLTPGAVLTEGDLRVAHMKADANVLATVFGTTDVASVRGHIVTDDVEEGSPIARTDVRSVSDHVATRVMSFPLSRAARSAASWRLAIAWMCSPSSTTPRGRATCSSTRQ